MNAFPLTLHPSVSGLSSPPGATRLPSRFRFHLHALLAFLGLTCLAWPGRAQLTVTDDLVLWLQADQLIATNETGQVTFWGDSSGWDNSATPVTLEESPVWVPAMLNSLPAVRFDGVDDYLQIANSPTLQPQSGDWTVIFVGKRLGASQGDFPQVIGSRPWTAGEDKGWSVGFGSGGNAATVGSHYADGVGGHDIPAVRSASSFSTEAFQIWQVEENRAAGRTVFYLNGDPDRSVASVMPDAAIDQEDTIYIGRDIGGANNRKANMEVAEMLVYARALSKADQEAVTTYLSDKYGFGFTPNVPPTITLDSPADGAVLAAPADLSLVATAEDSDGTIARVDFLLGDHVVATATAPPFAAPIRVMTPGVLTLTAVATDNRGGTATSLAATVTVTGSGEPPALEVTSGLQLRLDAGEGIATNLDGTINYWADLSGNDNAALQTNEVEAPLYLADQVNSLPVARFDGVDDFLEVANVPGLQPQSGDWTVLFLGKRLPNSAGDYPQVIGSRPWTTGTDKGWSVSFGNGNEGRLGSHYADGAAGHDVPATRTAAAFSTEAFQIWQVEENRGAGTTAFYLNGILNSLLRPTMPAGPIDQADPIYLGREIGGSNNRRANMDLAEVLVYNRVLDGTEQESVTTYLATKYDVSYLLSLNLPPTVEITSPVTGDIFVVPVEIVLSASPADADGSIGRVQFFRGDTLLGTVDSAPYDLVVSNGFPGTVTYTVVAFDNLGAFTRSAPVTVTNIDLSGPVPAPIDVANGLIRDLDYQDTFTVGTAARPDGLYNNNNSGGYGVESSLGNPSATWLPFSAFSFNSGEGTTCCGYPGNSLNDGAATGLAQSGGGDLSIAYGLRDSYVVQFDAILPGDRLDITSGANPGGGIFGPQSLTLFLRRDSVAGTPHAAFPDTGLPGIGLFNGTAETAVVYPDGSPVLIGVDDNEWHRYAVHFDRPNDYLGIYVDGNLLINVELSSVAQGAYLNYSNGAVGMGGAGGVFWIDNFQVGAPNRLLQSLDLTETFTVGGASRPDGLFNNNSGGGYNLESDPNRVWLPFSNFSFNTGLGSTCCGYPGNTGNDGAATGLAQSGGGDFSVEYGLSDSYVVEAEAVLPPDRLDISSMPAAGASLFTPNSLSVFFRLEPQSIGLFNGSAETPSGVTSGVSDSAWHQYAVHFDRLNQRLGLYVDGVLLANLDLTTFANGAYANYSNAAVGLGGTGVFWADNFQVGPAENALTSQLTIGLAGQDLVLSWTGPGVLQEAGELGNPEAWTDLPEARSPLVITPSEAAKFYRLRH